MLDDWLNVDFNSIIKQTLYTMDNYSEKEHQIIVDRKLYTYYTCLYLNDRRQYHVTFINITLFVKASFETI